MKINQAKLFFVLSLPLAAMGGALGCNSPEGTVTKFCRLSADQKPREAYDLLARRDKSEVSKIDYFDYEWDEKHFDVRIMRPQHRCSATITPLSEVEALATMKLSVTINPKVFACVLPLVKEEGVWKVTRHFAAAEKYLETLQAARHTLERKMFEIRSMEPTNYGPAANAAFANYWDSERTAKKTVLAAAAGTFPRFCHGPLNPDQGRDLIYSYLELQEVQDESKKPSQLVEKEALYAGYVSPIREAYQPISSMLHDGVRMDLIESRVTKEGLVRNLFLAWGPIHPPFEWVLYVYAKGKETHTMTGSAPEIVEDIPDYVLDGPNLTLVVFEFQKVPGGTDALKTILSDRRGRRDFEIELPVKSEFLIAGAR